MHFERRGIFKVTSRRSFVYHKALLSAERSAIALVEVLIEQVTDYGLTRILVVYRPEGQILCPD